MMMNCSELGLTSFIISVYNKNCDPRQTFSLFLLFFFFCFLEPQVQHMEVSRLGVLSELQQPGYATATAAWDLSHVCDLHHSSQKFQILDPLSEARDRTHILMDTSWICFHCTTTGTPGTISCSLPQFQCLFSTLYLCQLILSPSLDTLTQIQ